MSVFWLVVLAASLCVVTLLWIKEALKVAALSERLSRRERDIAQLDEFLLIRTDERWISAMRASQSERKKHRYSWAA